jgi:2-polyprenyl-6-hydroxyphenyl methylase / 3-demethylubiquinone-9 3-methyltransferase
MVEPEPPSPLSVDPGEIAKFSSLAGEWWNPDGKFAVLHKLNPVRLQYIREQVTARLGLEPYRREPFKGLRFLDIGCGGGLLSEPIARLGAGIVAIDPSADNIRAAIVHAAEQDLAIDYRVASAEELALAGEDFDVILNMEVVEHVNVPEAFIATCASRLKPGGLMFLATLNRTFKSFALAIIGAEYVMGWLPRGTHKWEKFITTSELAQYLEAAGLDIVDTKGVIYNPLSGHWSLAADTDVNYMVLAHRPNR